jgi:glycosyltransferase involved in cell wall biosynthesis
MNEMMIDVGRLRRSETRHRTKLLIVSSYRRPCGISQYVEHLEGPLREHGEHEVEVAALPVDLFRAQSPYARKAARASLQTVLTKAASADVVNLQFELGLFGVTPFQMWRRIKAVIGSARRVLLTYHTAPAVRSEPVSLTLNGLIRLIKSRRGSFVFDRLLAAVRSNPRKFHHIVHTQREAETFKLLGIPADTITVMPLAFLDASTRALVAGADTRDDLVRRYGLEGKRVLGCFGFLSDYKGTEVALRAMRYLPPDYHLLVVGGLHPEGVAIGTVDQPYVRKLTAEIELRSHPQEDSQPHDDLLDRVHFCGALGNEEFYRVMAACDAVVLPYAEVGQTSSGPAAIALDLQRPVYGSRTYCFRELDRFQPGMISFFEIGNHLELAQKILMADGARPERVKARLEYLARFSIAQRAERYVTAERALMRAVA